MVDFNFNLKKAKIFQAVKWERHPVFKWAGFFKKFFLIVFILTLSLFLIGFLSNTFSKNPLSFLLGFSILTFVFFISFSLIALFFNSKLKKPQFKVSIKTVALRPEGYNLAEFLSFETARAVDESIKFARSKKIAEVNSSLLLYFLLSDNPKLNFIFSRVLLSIKEVKKILEAHFEILKKSSQTNPSLRLKDGIKDVGYSVDFQNSILESLRMAAQKDHERIEIGDALAVLAKNDLIFGKILVDSNLKKEDIENLSWWLESLEEKIAESRRFWEYKNLARRGSLAKDWAAGYTILLDKYSIDWTDFIKKRGFEEIIGHRTAITQVERILARSEINNVLLVGEPGSGRGSIIQALAQKSLFGETLPNLNYKRVVELDLPSLLTETGGLEELEAILDRIFKEVVFAGNIILVINEFHNYIGQLVRPGVMDISGVLVPCLKSPRFQIVAVTTFTGLHKYIEENPSVLSLFEKVEVAEISKEETIRLLENLALVLEQKYKKFISYPALRQIVNYGSKYLPNIPFPKKAMDLLDEIMVYAAGFPKEKIILPRHVAKIISEKVQIPIGEMEAREREILINLENLIHQRIINQEEAVKEVSFALRRARAEVRTRKGPMGCFLFLGPTGVGKTETSKALSAIYFGSEDRMIRLDMSEFQDIKDIPRFIGSPGQEGLLTTKVRESPFALILLDEIEKAHPNILNLFLQVFDEGHLTDGLGRKVDFQNTIIIATSNAGYQIILKAIKDKKPMPETKDELLDFLFKEGIFRPEFMNRFDGVIIFKSLTKENLLDIAELLLKKLKKNLEEKGIEFIITQSLKEKITELSWNPLFGAREMQRTIQDKIENALASSLLKREIKRGDRIEIDPQNFQVLKEKQ